jgi:hypothetical protein
MSIFAVFGRSVRVVSRSPRLILLLYGCNLLIAAVVAAGVRWVLASSGSLAALEPLVRDFDFSLMSDFLRFRGEAVTGVLQTGILLACFSLPLQTILSAGTLTCLLEGRESFSFRDFFSGCGHFGPRFIRLGVMAILLAGIVVLLAIVLASLFIGKMTADATSETTVMGWGAGAFGFVMFAFFCAWTVTEYARIVLVRTDGRRVLAALRAAAGFVWNRIARVIGLQVILAGVACGILIVYLGIESALNASSPAMIVVTVLLQQLVILGRTWSRVLIFRGELGLHLTDAGGETADHAESAATLAGA